MSAEIDFLPASYVSVRTRRLQALCRHVLLAGLTLIVASGIVSESHRRVRTERIFQAIDARFRRLTARLPNAAELRDRMSAAEADAVVRAGLDVHVRPTRLLAAVTAALPRNAALTQFTLNTAEGPRFESSVMELAELGLDTRGAHVVAPQPRQIAEGDGQRDIRLVLEGFAAADEDVAEFLRGLQRSGVFDDIELQQIERAADAPWRRHFAIRLNVLPPTASPSLRRL